uniref:CRAL-TRIO domain-containing protein n=3 Tax=Rhizophora mucronata TaxID=61149 RepID=A0A2P2KY05_RHIMU
MKNFTPTAANLLAAMSKIDNSYYPETLHRMFIVNAGPGFKKMLWPAAQKFLDAKTISKIQVLDPKALPKLLEVIESSQLPDFLGGSCTCSTDGGCLKSNKGPWNDPEIMKLVHNMEATFVGQMTQATHIQQGFDSHIQMRSLKGKNCVTPTAGSGFDIDDPLPTGRNCSTFPSLAAVYKDARTSDSSAYHSCSENFITIEEPVQRNLGGKLSDKESLKTKNCTNIPCEVRSSMEGSLIIHWLDIVKEKLGKKSILCMARMLMSFMVELVAFFHSPPSKFWRHRNNIYPSSLIEHNADGHPMAVEAVSEEDSIHPCIERLERLEKTLEEVSNKPAKLPREQDQMLMESLERIKSVEFDLEKTKRVLHTTVVKQLEIAELLDNLRESKLRHRRFFC